ncbi:immunoglobulin domain-containing protein, partial [candidate division KSB1 bacterium]|nr:immunoglobulin domain-containing protein [candidate division KSB1 bacterium]
ALDGIRPEGWGIQGNATSNIHYWEYNSVNLSDGKPVDVSRRHPISRQLIKEKDAEIIADYSNPTNVLGGWTPEMAPVLLSQPEKVKVRKGETAEFKVKVAAIPEASIQWLKDDKPMNGENESILTIPNAEKSAVAGYSVLVQNRAGSVTSREAQLVID